jgi:hypothetical protein
MSIYERRYIAFIDILGFSNLIMDSTKSPDILEKIFRSLETMQAMKHINDKDKKNDSEISLFSDNIVISYLDNEYDAEANLIMDVMYLQMSLYIEGVLCRGGITVGDLYHDNNKIFGPAMVRAYELESKYANYPRIIVDDCLTSGGSFFTTDFDGIRFIDTLTNFCDLFYLEENIYDLYSKIDRGIKECIKTPVNNIGVKSKISWLENYVNHSFILGDDELKILDKYDEENRGNLRETFKNYRTIKV